MLNTETVPEIKDLDTAYPWIADTVYKNKNSMMLLGNSPITLTDMRTKNKEHYISPESIIWGYRLTNYHEKKSLDLNIATVRKMEKLGLVGFYEDMKVETVEDFDKKSDDFEGLIKGFKKDRPTWDEYFMGVATILSSRSTCDRLFVGSAIVKNNRLIGQGYNGSISGHAHCDDVGHLMVEGGCKRTIHAEMNALKNCTEDVSGATAYVTHYPCPECMKALNQAGVKEVVYGEHYTHRYDNNFDEGIVLRQYEGRKITVNWE